mmetsp:Transcript_20145/g.20241  ORF Transcript_20145/g.20241 Transcript_20145/m.20241 type:complete len:163 (-) Transcript_20145:35-523(-)
MASPIPTFINFQQVLLIIFAVASCNAFVTQYARRIPVSANRLIEAGRYTNSRKYSSALFAKWKVTIQHEGAETVLEVDEQTSVLEAALDAGIELPHDCKLGVCLTCPSRLVSGKLDQSTSSLDDSVQEKGYALTCMSYPLSDVVIASIDEEELLAAQFSDRS